MPPVEGDPLLIAKEESEEDDTSVQMTKDEMQLRMESTYWLARVALYRAMGGVYVVAFLVSAQQNKALLGDFGLDPVRGRMGSRPTPAFAVIGFGDVQLDIVAWVGVLLSLLMAFSIICSWLVPFCCWLLYLSIVNLKSQYIMSYGWEWQVLETGFLIIFLYPTFSRTPFPKEHPPSFIVIVLCRWLAFRVMLGTGLSKMGTSASACWRELTCTTTHYQTQPIPNAFAWFMHKLPLPVHKLEGVITLTIELLAPFLILVPLRNVRILGGLLPTLFMAAIILTGSYAYINWITLVPFIACLDDDFLRRWFFPVSAAVAVQQADAEWAQDSLAGSVGSYPLFGSWGDMNIFQLPIAWRWSSPAAFVERVAMVVASGCLALMVAIKSANPLGEMFSPSPWLNYYDDYFLVNAYGVFGFINKERVGVAFEYTHDGESWKDLDFPAVPGSADRMPAYVTPYHYRADWQVWIETTATMESSPAAIWAFNGVPEFMNVLVAKVLAGDTLAASLLAEPVEALFADGLPPRAVRATPYMYTFSNASALVHGTWWDRSLIHDDGADVAQPIVLSAAWKGPISSLPPSHDWSLLFPVLGAAVALAMMLKPPADKVGHTGYAVLGTWASLTGMLSLTWLLPAWAAAWLTMLAIIFIFTVCWLRVHSLDDLLMDVGPALKQRQEVCAAMLLAQFTISFALALLGMYWAAAAVLVLATILDIALLVLAFFYPEDSGRHTVDGLLVAATSLTLAALLSAVKAASFRAPVKL